MTFDPRHWNLILPLALAATACSARIPAAGDESGETESSSEGEDGSSDSGEDGSSDEGDGSGSDGGPECDYDFDCYQGYYCDEGVCVQEDYCDLNGPERCSPIDCYDDDECNFGESCAEFGECIPPEILPGCGGADPMVIPLGNLEPGVLHFAQADGDPEEDLLVVSHDAIYRIDGPDEVVVTPRQGGQMEPVRVESIDVDLDGVDELYVLESNGNGALVWMDGSEQEVDIEFGGMRAGNFLGDAEPELVGQLSAMPLELGLYSLADGPAEELATHQATASGIVLPLGSPNDEGFQDIQYVQVEPFEPTQLVTLQGAAEPDYVPAQRAIDVQSATAFLAGSGPLAGPADVPVLLEMRDGRSRLLAPSFGDGLNLPPSIAFEVTYERDEPVVVQHEATASVVLAGTDLVRVGFNGSEFDCQSTIEAETFAEVVASGDFTGDGRADLVTQDAEGNVVLYDFNP